VIYLLELQVTNIFMFHTLSPNTH